MEPIKNDQEAFDIVYKHMLTQKKRAMDAKGMGCRYRGAGGSKCAAGALIPDELYNPAYEDVNIRYILDPHDSEKDGPADLIEHFKNVSLDLLAKLQNIHDDVPVEIWQMKLCQLAAEKDLTIPKIED